MALEIGQIRHVGLFTSRVKDHARFYSDVWGSTPFMRRGTPFSSRLFTRAFRSQSASERPLGLHHIAYAVAGDESIRRAASLLKEAGVHVVQAPARWMSPATATDCASWIPTAAASTVVFSV